MNQPWKCPDCSAWIAPGVTQHRCDDPPAATAPAAPIGPQPITGPYCSWSMCIACGAHYVGWHRCVSNAMAYPAWIGWPLSSTCSSGMTVIASLD